MKIAAVAYGSFAMTLVGQGHPANNKSMGGSRTAPTNIKGYAFDY